MPKSLPLNYGTVSLAKQGYRSKGGVPDFGEVGATGRSPLRNYLKFGARPAKDQSTPADTPPYCFGQLLHLIMHRPERQRQVTPAQSKPEASNHFQ